MVFWVPIPLSVILKKRIRRKTTQIHKKMWLQKKCERRSKAAMAFQIFGLGFITRVIPNARHILPRGCINTNKKANKFLLSKLYKLYNWGFEIPLLCLWLTKWRCTQTAICLSVKSAHRQGIFGFVALWPLLFSFFLGAMHRQNYNRHWCVVFFLLAWRPVEREAKKLLSLMLLIP